MAQEHPTLRHIPLHVVANILGQLESMSDLNSAVSSHPLFTNAFNTHRRLVLTDIVLGSIPYATVPFALGLQETNVTKTPDDVRKHISTLNSRRRDPDQAREAVLTLPEGDLRGLSKIHEAVKWLSDDFARDNIPLFKKHLGLSHLENPSEVETFRVQRALYRYGMLCTLFCDETTGDDPAAKNVCVLEFLHNFSPWVNEELLCVYQYLRRKLGRALSCMCAHDVVHGEIGMPGFFDYDETDGHMDDLLAWSLPRIRDVCRGEEYDDWSSLLAHGNLRIRLTAFEPSTYLSEISLLRSDMNCTELGIVDFGDDDMILGCVEPVIWDTMRERRDIDRIEGLGILSSERIWRLAYSNIPLDECVQACVPNTGLRECGYVIWDAFDRGNPLAGTEHEKALKSKLDDVFGVHSFYSKPDLSDWELHSMSLEQRSAIWLSGGAGYWETYKPGSGTADFSRITGLDDAAKQELVEIWDTGYIPSWSHRARSDQNA